MSLLCLLFVLILKLTYYFPWSHLGGAPPKGGRGQGAGPGGPPRGGSPGPTRRLDPISLQKPRKKALGGSWRGPCRGPRGLYVGTRGPLGGSGGPSRGGTPRGAARWPPSLRARLPVGSRPPGGAPRGPAPRRGWGGAGALGGGKKKEHDEKGVIGGAGGPPPRAAPPGGPYGGLRTPWGQNQANSSITEDYSGGRGATQNPKA
jgi:hypothetical protein